MAIIKDETIELIRDEVARRNEILRNFAQLYQATTWDAIQANVRSGHGKDMYPLGTELICNYTHNGITYEFPWIVVDNDRQFTLGSGITVPGLVLQAKYATIESMPFDAPERELATEETALAGTYYCGFKNNTYTMLNLAEGDTIPYSSYTKVYHGSVNNRSVYQNGYNRWSMSAARQWLNSDKAAGQWWTSQHVGDTAPQQANTYDGFMRGLDEDFLAVISPVHIKTLLNAVTDGGSQEDTVDKFWLASVEEEFGVPQVENVEGPYFPYVKAIMGVTDPQNQVNNARRVKLLNDTSTTTNAWLRTPQRNYTYSSWYNYVGSMSTQNSLNNVNFQPVCVLC